MRNFSSDDIDAVYGLLKETKKPASGEYLKTQLPQNMAVYDILNCMQASRIVSRQNDAYILTNETPETQRERINGMKFATDMLRLRFSLTEI